MTVDCRNPARHDHRFGQGARTPKERRMLIAVWLTITVMIGEVIVGLWSGSMALLADGVHMGTHTIALGVAWLAYVLTRRHASDRRFSFGTGKVQELAGFGSAILLAVGAVMILFEAVPRLLAPQSIHYTEAIAVAFVGLLANVASFWILRGAAHESHDPDEPHVHEPGDDHTHADSNLRGAVLHVLADAMTSVGAIVALLAGRYLGWSWLDSVVAIVAAVVIAVWAVSLLRATARVLLDQEASANLRAAVKETLEADADTRVADLHVWAVGPGIHTVIASVIVHGEQQPSDYRAPLEERLGIVHPVIEVQRCEAPEHAA
ncbi:MAG: CDF family Co(II)/Ni(II) efflux transporter DmeF [Steroidobacteraceae bacterium]